MNYNHGVFYIARFLWELILLFLSKSFQFHYTMTLPSQVGNLVLNGTPTKI